MKLQALVCVASIAVVGAVGAGVAGASSTPTQYFTSTQTSVDGPQTIVAAGPISATGTDTVLGNHRDTFVFPDGTLWVRHEPLTETQKFDSRTCVGTFVETGTYVIQRGSGDYRHTTGSGTYKVNGYVQGCDRSAPPTSFSVIIQAHGPLTL